MRSGIFYRQLFPCLLFVAVLVPSRCALANTTILATGVDTTRGEGIWIKEDGVNQNAYFAGVILIAVSQNGQQFNRDSLCVDLFTDIYLNTTYNSQIMRPDQEPGRNLDRVSWLVDNALLPTQGSYSSLLPSADWVKTPAQGAGMQLAIWDITTDGGDGFSSGRVRAATGAQTTDPTALAWAQTYETLSYGKVSDLAFVYLNTDIHTGAQVQMLEGPLFTDGGPVPIPEPATYVLVGAALIGIGVWSRRAMKRRASGK